MNPVHEKANKERERVVQVVKAAADSGTVFTVCTDTWTGHGSRQFMDINLYWFDDDLNLKRITYGVFRILVSASSENLRRIVTKVLLTDGTVTIAGAKVKGMGLSPEHIAHMVTDGASNMSKLASLMGVSWGHCAARKLNLVVKDALKEGSAIEVCEM